MGEWIWITLALAAVLGLAFVPWTLVLVFDRPGSPRVSGTVAWAGMRLGSFRSSSEPTPGTQSPRQRHRRFPSPASKKGSSSRRSSRRARAVLRSRGFLPAAARCVRRLLRQLRPRHERFAVRFGLDNPSDTALLWSVFAPMSVLLQGSICDPLTLEPDFSGSRLEIQGQTRVRVVPGMLLLVLTGFVLSAPARRALVRAARSG